MDRTDDREIMREALAELLGSIGLDGAVAGLDADHLMRGLERAREAAG